MQITDKRTFNGGLNSDLDYHAVPNDTYKHALNMRINSQGNEGVITTVKGNELVSYSLPAGGNKVIGVKEYDNGSAIFYFVWNSNEEHVILRYDYALNKISTVIKGDILEFSQESLITGIDIVTLKDQTLLYWTDNMSEPKKLSVEACIRLYDPVESVYKGVWLGQSVNAGDVVSVLTFSGIFPRDLYYVSKTNNNTTQPYTTNASLVPEAAPSEQWELMSPDYMFPPSATTLNLTQLVRPPRKAPLVRYEDNEDEKSNRLRGYMWQFRYKYVYGDGQESAWSPISKVPLPNSVINPLATGYFEEWRDNQIKVGVEVENNAAIRSVKLAARIVPDSKAPLDFELYKEVYLNDLSQNWGVLDDGVTVGLNDVFTNKEDKTSIPQIDLAQLFYWIPRRSKAQVVTLGNELIHGNCVFGYDVDPNLINQNPPQIDASYNDADVNNDAGFTISSIPTPQDDVPVTYNFFDVSEHIDATVDAGQIIKVSFSGDSRVREGFPPSATTYPSGFDNPDGVKLFSFSQQYTIKKEDVDDYNGGTITLLQLQERIASDISELIKAASIKEWFFRSDFGNPKAVTYSTEKNFVYSTSLSSIVRLVVSTGVAETALGSRYFVDTKVKEATVEYITTEYYAKKSFKRGSTSTFGFVYSDNLGRVTNVITNDACKKDIDWYYAGTSKTKNGSVDLSMSVYHEAPDWATKCHIVKKIDNGVTKFVQLPLSIGNLNEDTSLNSQSQGYYFATGIVADDGLTRTDNYGGVSTINIFLNALNGSGESAYNNLVDNSVITYSFTKGDRLRFISNFDQTIYFDDDVEILGYNDTFNYVTINANALRNDSSPNLLSTLLHKSNQTNGATVEGAMFEIYTPQNQEDLKGFYYETGITLDVVNGEHVGTDGVTQDLATGTPAVVELDCGDVYYKNRWYSLNLATGAEDGAEFALEDYNYSDVFNSRAFDYGRYNFRAQVASAVDSNDRSGIISEQYRPNTMFYSEPYIQGTNINRLGTIYDINFKDTDSTFNSIQLIHSLGDRLRIYQEDRVAFAYNNRYVTTSLNGVQTISSGAAAPPISDIQYYAYNGGISLNPESHCFNDSREYFFDLRRGNICRMSQDGVTPISLKSIDKYVKGISDKMIRGVEKDICISAFDKRNTEAVFNFKWSDEADVSLFLTFESPSETADFYFVLPTDTYESQFVVGETKTITTNQTIPSGALSPNDLWSFSYTVNRIESGRMYGNFVDTYSDPVLKNSYKFNYYKSDVISFSDTWNTWVSKFSYIPDYLGTAGLNLVSFKNGQLYLHDSDNVAYGNFYGTDYASEIAVTSNIEPTNVKTLLALSVGANVPYDVDGGYPISSDSITTSSGQSSSLISEDFDYKEGVLSAAYLRDENTLYVDNPILDGDRLQGRWANTVVKINGGLASPVEIFFARVISKLSHVLK